MTGRRSFGSVRRRESGRWQARWQDDEGHQHHAPDTFATKREATAWLAGIETDRRRGTWTDPRDGRILFADWADEWRATIVNLRPSTRARDLVYLDSYLIPTFGCRRLDDIDHMAIRAWLAELAARGLAPATIVKAAQILAKILRLAVTARRLPVSPCDNLDLPRVERDEMRFLTPDQLADLAAAIDPRYRGVVLLGGYGGLRPGELFGLKVGRVDPLRRQVHVVEQVVEASGHLHVGPPKTTKGTRVVPIPPFVADALVSHMAGRIPDDLMFPAPEGAYVRLSTWRIRFWRPALKRAGIDDMRVHDLRHTAVALWIEAGASVLEMARRAGHESTVTLQDRYGHLMPGAEERTNDRLEEIGRAARQHRG